ncbi:MAG: putative sulfate exporter family transporter [Deltaproteobacteria bacterium]|nr:putative sulfate exporter family transporter [Deltaproteobacteria bacterium]
MQRAPGLLLATLIAIAAYQIHALPIPPFSIGDPVRHPIDAMLIAIVLGLLFRNTVGMPARLVPGVRAAVVSLTAIGIVMMGAKLDFQDMARTSVSALAISVVCVVAALALTIWLCRRLGVNDKLGMLIGVGTAICGSSAIAVAAPVIEADDSDTAFSIATVTLFGMIAVFVLPLLGNLIGLDETEFGVWAGTSVHAVPQVVAAGFAYGPTAGEVATIVKLVRVLLLAPVVIGLAIWYGRQKRAKQIAHITRIGSLRTLVPPFIVGFLVLALANTLHLLPDFTLHLRESFLWEAGDRPIVLAQLVTSISSFLLTISMAGVGMGVDLRGLARVGLGALYVGLASAVLLAGFSLVLLRVLL